MKKKEHVSEFMQNMYESAQDLFDVGAISKEELKELEIMCLTPDDSPIIDDTNPFVNLDQTEFRGLAELIGSDVTFVTYLRDRVLEFNSIPQAFVKEVSKILEIPVSHLNAHFSSNERVLMSSEHHKSDDAPDIDTKISYEKAVNCSKMSKSQKDHLHSFMDEK